MAEQRICDACDGTGSVVRHFGETEDGDRLAHWQCLVDEARAEVERLLAVIHDAPHFRTCPQSPDVDASGWESDVCRCWKSWAVLDHNVTRSTPLSNPASLVTEPTHSKRSTGGVS